MVTFMATLADVGRGRVFLEVPFDPDETWGPKPRHLVHGTAGGCRLRGAIETVDGGFGLTLGGAWLRDHPVPVGEEVTVTLEPEGPLRGDLAPDIAEALAADPAAAAFFDSLAQFYRRAYLKWIDGTKRRPEVRAQRIAEMVEHLAAGRKTR